MQAIQYHSLVWLTYRLAATFAFGLPLIILVWASIKKEACIKRLLFIYWKVSSLIAISILLLTSKQSIGYITSFVSPIVIIGSLWFWIDLNEEIDEMPQWRPLALTVRVWRWSISFSGLLYCYLSFLSLSCFQFAEKANCIAWIQDPQNLHQTTKVIFNFLFGGNWSQSLSGFIGYLTLIIYLIGLIQWILIRLPKQGRIAGDF
tara:strand:- start:13381 stop:13992 length:612 start_codon:yes stop_codon:yes gene_type:complete